MDTEALRKSLPELRIRRGWSQEDLGREAGVRADTVSSIERGRHSPRPSTLRKLAEVLDVEVAELFGPQATSDAVPGKLIMLSDDTGEVLAERVRNEEDPDAALEEIESNVLVMLGKYIRHDIHPDTRSIIYEMLRESIPAYSAGLASYALRQQKEEGREDLEGALKDGLSRVLTRLLETDEGKPNSQHLD